MHRFALLLVTAASVSAASLTPFPFAIPVAFEENRGQSPKEFRLLVSHANVGLACDAIYQQNRRIPLPTPDIMRFVDANANCTSTLSEQQSSISRFYRGENLTKSIDNVFHYRKARFSAVWPGIDLEYTAKSNAMVATFQLNAASSLSQVRLQARSINGFVDSALVSELGVWQLSADQNRSLKVRGDVDYTTGIAHFVVDGADPSQPLTLSMEIPVALPIDMFARNYVDRAGNWYLASSANAYALFDPSSVQCLSSAFTTACPDAYVASFDSKGNLRYLVYLMGSRYDAAMGITADPAGNVFVTGTTYSKDFVTTAGVLQPTYAGPEVMTTLRNPSHGGDAFVVKLDGPSGSLIYSTYLGTEAVEVASAIYADGNGRVSLIVDSAGKDLPLKGEPIVESAPCCTRLISLNEDGSSLRYALAVPIAQALQSEDGSMYLLVNNYMNRPPDELIALTPQGSLKYRRTVESPAGIALRPNGELWLATFQQSPLSLSSTLYQIDALGGEPRIVAEGMPPVWLMESDGDGGLWFTVYSKDAAAPPPAIGLTALGDAPLKQSCYSCGGLLHVDGSGVTRLATFVPIDANFLQATAGKVFIQASYTSIGGSSAFVLNEADASSSFIATAADTANPSAEFYDGNLISIIGAKLGPENEVRFPVDSTGRAATNVDGLRVLVDNKECVILSANADRIVALLPSQLPFNGSGVLTVEQNGSATASMPFRYGGRGFEIVAGPNAPFGSGFENEDGTMNGKSNPAPVGSVVKFHIVAVGPTTPQQIEREVKHSVLPRPSQNIDVRFGFNEPPQELVSLHQSEQFVTGIFEVRVRVGSNVPSDAVPVMLGLSGFAQPQWSMPQLYVRQ